MPAWLVVVLIFGLTATAYIPIHFAIRWAIEAPMKWRHPW